MSSLFRDSHGILAWTARQSNAVTFNDVPSDTAKTVDVERFTQSMYAVLTAHTEGEALRVVRSQEADFNGLEAFRRLSSRFDAKSAVRGFNMVTRLSAPPQCPTILKLSLIHI